MTYTDKKTITNDSNDELYVFVEPDALDLKIRPGAVYSFTSTSEKEG